MSYVTVNGASDVEAQSYADTELVSVRADALLRDAERIVASIATLADDSAEYQEAARDAELRVFEELASRRSTIRREEAGSVKVAYFEPGGDGYEVVRHTLSAYIPAEQVADAENVGYISRVSW